MASADQPGSRASRKRKSATSDAARPTRKGAAADQRLAERCLAGEVAAWEELYRQCHLPLLSSIRLMLGGVGTDANLVDEIAARVWYIMVADDGAILARYSPEHDARLVTFMRAIAKDVACRLFRAERRRRHREAAATRAKVRRVLGDPTRPADSVDDFLATLSPEERTFCDEYLLDPAVDIQDEEEEEESPSSVSLWRWSQRIYRKLLRFLERV